MFDDTESRSFPKFLILCNDGIGSTVNLFVTNAEVNQQFPIYDPGNNAFIDYNRGSVDAFITKFSGVKGNELTGVEFFDEKVNEITLYPNPIGGAINKTSLQAENGLILNYKVFNAMGQFVKGKDVNAKEIQIDLTGQQPGIYFIESNSEFGTEIHKLVVQ